MKKQFLLAAITMVFASCQKQTIEPEPVNNIQQTTSCGPLGACWSGTFQYDSALTSQYVLTNPTVQDTALSNFYYTIYGDRDSLSSVSGKWFVHYTTDSLTQTYTFLVPWNLVYGNPWLLKNQDFASSFLLTTKTNKSFIVKRTSYMY